MNSTIKTERNNNIYYELNENGTLIFKGLGKLNKHCLDLPIDKKSIKKIIINEGITSIGSFMFCNFINLTDVKLPKSLIEIELSAFDSCQSLENINLEDNIKSIGKDAFLGCSKLTINKLPKNLQEIQSGTFCGINKIVISKNVTKINEFSLDYLNEVVADNENQIYDSRNNCNCIIETKTNTLIVGTKNSIIPNNISKIGDWAFVDSEIEKIIIPKSVNTIGEHAFDGCKNLKEIHIYKDLANIYKSAFNQCNNLEGIFIE